MHPYRHFPPRQFWNSAVAGTPWAEVLAQETGKFPITADDVVVSAGSCFAQRISRLIVDAGLDYRYFEQAHPLVPPQDAAAMGYGTFSCRYGNVYTTRQLLQLVKEALGLTPQETLVTPDRQGRHLDLLRPHVDPAGFESVEEAVADRAWHLKCVARMLAESDVFIFTLGLTEAWVDEKGRAFGSHPAVATKCPSPLALKAHNFDYIECYNDLVEVFNLLRGVNPGLRFILTVSPVALAATHQAQHVLVSTAYSKAVLRAVAGKFAELLPHVDYFPSFEIFNLAQSFGQFLSEDLRDVSPRGVQVAMANFQRMFLQRPGDAPQVAPAAKAPGDAVAAQPGPALPTAADVECDEILNACFDGAQSA